MLSKKRVLHMTRMEMHRQKEAAEIAPFLNLDRRDYLSFVRVTGFIAGSVFYGIALAAVLLFIFAFVVTDYSRSVLIMTVIMSVIGYVVFMFFYQSYIHQRAIKRMSSARRKIKRLRRDWLVLEEIYRQEEDAAKPTVDMDELFPQGSLGEEVQ